MGFYGLKNNAKKFEILEESMEFSISGNSEEFRRRNGS